MIYLNPFNKLSSSKSFSVLWIELNAIMKHIFISIYSTFGYKSMY